MVDVLKPSQPPLLPVLDQARDDATRVAASEDLPSGTSGELALLIEETLQSQFRNLRFPKALEAVYAQDTQASRVKALQGTGVAIAFLMNLFLVSDLAMVPDMFGTALVWRLWLYTPLILASLWMLGRMRNILMRELFVAQAGMGACVIQVALCVGSHSPHALAYLVGITMVVFFSNVYSRIRFWVAMPVNAVYVLTFVLGVCLMPHANLALVIPIALMLMSTTLFTLYYLYTLEHEERHNYLLGQRQRVLSDALTQANVELERVSRTDALTQVANRRHFDEAMSQIWERARMGGQEVCVLMLDIDHFKLFNDRYGHPAGDACLVEVAQVLRQCLRRPGDLVARYGGEEFIAVFQQGAAQQAWLAAQRVRSAVEDLDIAHEDAPLHGRVTVSIGWACVRPDERDASVQRLIAMADEALYQAKNRGRNGVWPLVSAPSEGGAA
jgi:diguanylate cyclase (GGDEF)-like protein